MSKDNQNLPNFELSKRVGSIKPSATLTINAQAVALRAAGKKIIPMGSGEPDFATPENIQIAGAAAIFNGHHRYTAIDGTPELKAAIIEKFNNENGLDYSPENIIASAGGKQIFYNLCQAILNPGDEVIIPAPYWVSYPDMVKLAGGSPVFVETDLGQNFKITPAQLQEKITEKSKLFVINSPSNPTGSVYQKSELEALAAILKNHPKILILSDDIYEHIRWDNENFVNIAMVEPALKNRTIILNGVSKAYAMTGWRLGFGAGPKEIIQAMKKIQGQSTSNPSAISQEAARTALQSPSDFIPKMVAEFKKRHDFLVASLNEINGIECPKSAGAFYAFAEISGIIRRLGLKDDIEFCAHCLEKLNIALVPGSAFGASNFVRFSFATSMENIKIAVQKLREI